MLVLSELAERWFSLHNRRALYSLSPGEGGNRSVEHWNASHLLFANPHALSLCACPLLAPTCV